MRPITLPRLARLRDDHALSLSDLAERTGLSRSYLWRCERDANPTLDVLRKLARALGVTVGELVGDPAPEPAEVEALRDHLAAAAGAMDGAADVGRAVADRLALAARRLRAASAPPEV